MAIALKINASLHYKVLYIKTIDNFLEVTRYGILTKIVLYICKLLWMYAAHWAEKLYPFAPLPTWLKYQPNWRRNMI